MMLHCENTLSDGGEVDGMDKRSKATRQSCGGSSLFGG